jgi:3-hydroxy acid dehydrogenase/malonic semialdehyde reductase
MRLLNKIVLITGASSGIGRECAAVFAEAGARLILLARRVDRLAELSEQLRAEYGTETCSIECDVRDSARVFAALDTLPENWRSIDVLINNAGLSRGLDVIHEGRLDDWEEMIDTNVKGLLYVSRAVLPGMVQRQTGMVINMASIAGREVYPKGNVYCATKHAVRALSEGMRIDTNGTGVRVCNIDPGLVETEFSEVRFRGDTDRAEKVYEGYTPLHGRDIADAALFCATRPPHVTIADMLVLPLAQAAATIVHKQI